MEGAQSLERFGEALLLRLGLTDGEDFCGSKMGKGAFQAQMWAVSQRPRKALRIGSSNPQPVHARIDLEVKAHRTRARALAPSGAERRRGAFEKAKLFALGDGGGEAILDQPALFTRPEAGQYENRLADAAFTQLGAFGGRGHSEPVRAGHGERLGHGHGA